MRIWVLLASLIIGLGSALADDPPGYARALVGHVTKIVPEGLVVEGVNVSQLHLLPPPPGVDHMCFAGIGGSSLVRGVRTKYRVGDQIEIMVTLAKGTYLLTMDPTHQVQLEVSDWLADSLSFPLNVDWNPSSSKPPQPPATPNAVPATSSSNTSSSSFNPGSIDDPVLH